MKKIYACLSLALLLVTTFATSCGSPDSAGKKKYVIATDTVFAPFEYTDIKTGKLVGVDIEIFEAIAKDQDISFEWESVGFSAAVAGLEAKQYDAVIAGMSITEKREKVYTFGDSYYTSSLALAFDASVDLSSASSNDEYLELLRGKTVAAKTATVGYTYADSIKDTYGFTIKAYTDSSLMYQAVTTGVACACFEDNPVIGYQITKGIGLKIASHNINDVEDKYGFAVLKDTHPELVEKFNEGLKNIKASGKYAEILTKYGA